MTLTPVKPSMRPITLFVVIFSSWVKKCAATKINSGDVALRIDAKPPSIWVCPQTIRLNGITLFSTLMTKNAQMIVRLSGSFLRVRKKNNSKVTAAMVDRNATTVRGGSSSSATSTRKNEPPHNMDKVINIIHSDGLICCVLLAMLLATAVR